MSLGCLYGEMDEVKERVVQKMKVPNKGNPNAKVVDCNQTYS